MFWTNSISNKPVNVVDRRLPGGEILSSSKAQNRFSPGGDRERFRLWRDKGKKRRTRAPVFDVNRHVAARVAFTRGGGWGDKSHWSLLVYWRDERLRWARSVYLLRVAGPVEIISVQLQNSMNMNTTFTVNTDAWCLITHLLHKLEVSWSDGTAERTIERFL